MIYFHTGKKWNWNGCGCSITNIMITYGDNLEMKSFLDFIQISLSFKTPQQTRARYNQSVRKRENQSEEMLDQVPLHFRKPLTVPACSWFYTHSLFTYQRRNIEAYLLSHPNKLLPKISVSELSSASLLFPLEASVSELHSVPFLFPGISVSESSQPIYIS